MLLPLFVEEGPGRNHDARSSRSAISRMTPRRITHDADPVRNPRRRHGLLSVPRREVAHVQVPRLQRSKQYGRDQAQYEPGNRPSSDPRAQHSRVWRRCPRRVRRYPLDLPPATASLQSPAGLRPSAPPLAPLASQCGAATIRAYPPDTPEGPANRRRIRRLRGGPGIARP